VTDLLFNQRYIGVTALAAAASQVEEQTVSPVDACYQALTEIEGQFLNQQNFLRLAHARFGERPHAEFFAMGPVISSLSSYNTHLAAWRDEVDVLLATAILPSERAIFGEPQLVLPIHGGFTPSEKLVNLWRLNVESLARDSGVRFAKALSDSEAAKEFSKTLTLLIGSIGQELRYSESPSTIAASNGMFSSTMQLELCERFLILPFHAHEFLTLLYGEILDFLKSGTTFSGGWGKLTIPRPNEIAFQLTAPNYINDPDFERAKEVR
jgi:hypothetical protein